jgi:hypothetical protein
LALAVAAPLVKAEGVAVIAGVLGYEVIQRWPPALTWKLVPFLVAPAPFVWWEWTTTDQLSSQRGLGLNVISSGLGYLRQLILPLDPGVYFQIAGGTLRRALNTGIGLALLAEGAVLATLFLIGLSKRSSWLLVLFGLAGTAPALVVTLGTQSRYIYFAGLVAAPVIATGANRVFVQVWARYSHEAVIPAATFVIAVLLSFETWITAIQSGSLRAAHSESIAFRNAVLAGHSVVPAGTPICILHSPLDVGSATAVFADPLLPTTVGLPHVTKCASEAQASPDEWVYERQPDGAYIERR